MSNSTAYFRVLICEKIDVNTPIISPVLKTEMNDEGGATIDNDMYVEFGIVEMLQYVEGAGGT